MPPEVSALLKNVTDDLCEIRIRKNRKLSLVYFGRTEETEIYINGKILEKCIDNMCSHSLYSHMDTINNGYISVGYGIRAGVCGRAICENGKIKSISEITSINIRISRDIPNISNGIYSRISRGGYTKSLLIYSPPSYGKTTILRDIVAKLSSNPPYKRVALVDTRCEIETARISACQNVDILSGYPRGKGIEIATRTLSPEYIICDEIGTFEEAEALLSSQNCGVPIIATAHASSVDELLLRKNIFLLHEAGVFSEYIGIKRMRNLSEPIISIAARAEVH